MPLPAKLDEETQRLISFARRRQDDLTGFQIPRLRGCEGPLAAQQHLAAELREDVDTFAHQVETLDVLIEDQRGEANRKELNRIVEEFKNALAGIRNDSRSAVLTSKRAIDSQAHSYREQLLGSSVLQRTQDTSEKHGEDALMRTSNNVTEALQRTIVLMQGELERSVLATQILDESTATLRSASTAHDVLSNLMGTSKQLISALAKSDALDRLLIISALAFFFLVVLFVIKQRVVDRGLRIALWWTRYLPDFSSGADLVRKESGGDGLSNGASSIIVVVSSAVAQTSSLSIASAHPEVQTILSESEMTLQPTEISLSHISLFSALSADPERSTPISTHDEL